MIKRMAAAVAVIAGAGLVPAYADTVQISWTWDVLDQDGMSAGTYFDRSWVATAAETVLVTGLYVLGDNFKIYDNGASVASTNAVDWTATGASSPWDNYAPDADTAWATTGPYAFAHATFAVKAGDVVTIQTTSIPTDMSDGAVAVRGVPEAPTWAMALIGFLGLGALAGLAKRRAARSAA